MAAPRTGWAESQAPEPKRNSVDTQRRPTTVPKGIRATPRPNDVECYAWLKPFPTVGPVRIRVEDPEPVRMGMRRGMQPESSVMFKQHPQSPPRHRVPQVAGNGRES